MLLLPYLLLAVVSCRPPLPEETGFYFWRSSFDFGEDKTLADSLRVKHLYLHMFDVVWSEGYKGLVPVAESNAMIWDFAHLADRCDFIPVVYLVNDGLALTPDSAIERLATRIAGKLTQMIPPEYWTEFQLDCDWSAETRERYFHLLRAIHQHLPPDKQLSCTLRLHQYKYMSASGIPPVDRMSLMCYNMDEIKDLATPNSIFSPVVLKQYLSHSKYPLTLDIALPVYDWVVVFQGKDFAGILHNPDYQLLNDTAFFHETEPHHYQLRRDTAIGNLYLREGDLFRLEKTSPEALREGLSVIRNVINTEHSRLLFFDWNPKQLRENYAKEIMDWLPEKRS
ncbi:MAG: hypothetical protein EAZ89_06760, partial [Bacteroidetes bacterium]